MKHGQLKLKHALLAASLALCAPLAAGPGKAMAKIQHALGWDTVALKNVETDAAGRPTLERDENDANRIERKTRYHDSGKKAGEETKVEARDSGKNLYHGKKSWDEAGELEYFYEEDSAFKGDRRTKGVIVEKRFEHGRLTREVKKKYSPEAEEWSVVYLQKAEYYPDGDLKERITEKPADGETKRETWSGDKGMTGRKKTTHTWDDDRNDWRP